MSTLRFIVLGSTCVTAFAGSTYIVAVSLAPPPHYTVSNSDRLHRYNELAINNAYEKKTRMQEFYLGLTRWRRRMLQGEKVLTGRVLEVGAGCGGNLSLYPATYFSDDSKLQAVLPDVLAAPTFAAWRRGRASRSDETAAVRVLHDVLQTDACDEVVLCDRAANMVDACVRKVQAYYGYTPYRYPDYDVSSVAAVLRSCYDAAADTHTSIAPTTTGIPSSSSSSATAGAATALLSTRTPSRASVRIQKTVRGDGSVSEDGAVVVLPEPGDVDAAMVTAYLRHAHTSRGADDGHTDADDNVTDKDAATAATVAVPLVPVPASTLMSPRALVELQRRQDMMHDRRRLRCAMLRVVQLLHDGAADTHADELVNPLSIAQLPSWLRGHLSWHDDAAAMHDASHTPPPPQQQQQQQQQQASRHATSDAKDSHNSNAHGSTHNDKPDNVGDGDGNKVPDGRASLTPRLRPQPLFAVANYAAEQLPFADNSFDTVVDMFGLCSYDDPVRALRELSRVCKPDGKLLLLEHGKGTSARVNRYLDKWAPRHAKQWGCWWNRQMPRVLRLSGVVVRKHEVRHFGTSHYIIATPYKTMDELEEFAAAAAATTTMTTATTRDAR